MPCGQCVRRGCADSCFIEDRRRGRTGDQRQRARPAQQRRTAPDVGQDVDTIKDRLSHLESLLAERRGTGPDVGSPRPHWETAPRVPSAHWPMGAPSQMTGAYPGQVPFDRHRMHSSSPKLPGRPHGPPADHPIHVERTGRPPVEERMYSDLDRDTEDAALVLEGLATGGAMPFKRESETPAQRTDDSVTRCNEACSASDDPLLHSPHCSFRACGRVAQKVPPAHPMRQPTPELPSASASELESVREQRARELRPCELACCHNGLLKLTNGTESSLGWGLGWAFASAEERGELQKIRSAKAVPGTTQKMVSSPEREAVLRQIVRALPPKEITEAMVSIFERRVQSLSFNVVHIPTLRLEVAAFYALETTEMRARAVEHVDPAWLGVLLLVCVLAVRFRSRTNTVCSGGLGEYVHPRFSQVWLSAAKTTLVIAGFLSSSRISVLQVIILLCFQCTQSVRGCPALLNVAIANAQKMGLHRLGDRDKQPQEGERPELTVRREIGKRVWWALVMYDACKSFRTTLACTIHPRQFNTPLPGNYNDVDLSESPVPPERPADELTEMSFALSSIRLTDVLRENMDELNDHELEQATRGIRSHLPCDVTVRLDNKYRAVLDEAPPFFRPGSKMHGTEVYEVQRWVLQQNVFNKLLALHRPHLSRKSARHCCVQLARSILDMQKLIRSRSDLANQLTINISQSFSAAIVLCLDLLQSPPPAPQRITVRSEINEGIDALKSMLSDMPGIARGVRVIEALMEEEELQWNDGFGPKKNPLHMALRILQATSSKCASKAAACNDVGTSTPPSAALDVASAGIGESDYLAFPPSQPEHGLMDPFQMGAKGIELGVPPTAPIRAAEFDLRDFINQCETDDKSPHSRGIMSSNASSDQVPGLSSGSLSDAAHGLSTPSDTPWAEPTQTNGDLPVPVAETTPNWTDRGVVPPTHSPSGGRNMDSFWDWLLGQGSQEQSSQVTMPQGLAPDAGVTSTATNIPSFDSMLSALNVSSNTQPLDMPSTTAAAPVDFASMADTNPVDAMTQPMKQSPVPM